MRRWGLGEQLSAMLSFGAHSSGNVFTIAFGVADSSGLTASASVLLASTDATQANIGAGAKLLRDGVLQVQRRRQVLVECHQRNRCLCLHGPSGSVFLGVAGGSDQYRRPEHEHRRLIGDLTTVNALGKTAGCRTSTTGRAAGSFGTYRASMASPYKHLADNVI